jgi:hypothetical protein
MLGHTSWSPCRDGSHCCLASLGCLLPISEPIAFSGGRVSRVVVAEAAGRIGDARDAVAGAGNGKVAGCGPGRCRSCSTSPPGTARCRAGRCRRAWGFGRFSSRRCGSIVQDHEHSRTGFRRSPLMEIGSKHPKEARQQCEPSRQGDQLVRPSMAAKSVTQQS